MVLILWFLALVAAGDVLAYLVGLLVEYQWGSYPSLVVFLAMYAVTLWVGQCQKVKRISCHILSVPILLGRYDLGRKGRHLAARSNRQPSVPDRMASPWRNDMAQNPAEGISAAIRSNVGRYQLPRAVSRRPWSVAARRIHRLPRSDGLTHRDGRSERSAASSLPSEYRDHPNGSDRDHFELVPSMTARISRRLRSSAATGGMDDS
jgi:hypothetical protein